MKFTMDVATLAKELAPITRIVGLSARPVLECVRIEAVKPSRLSLSGTNLVQNYTTYCPADVTVSGRALFDAHALSALLKTLSGPITVESGDDNHSKLKCAGTSAKLPGLDPEDFPTIADPPAEPWATFDAKKLLSAFAKTIFIPRYGANKKDAQARYHAEALLIIVSEDGASICGADGHRISFAKLPGVLHGERREVVVPWRGPQALLDMREQIEKTEPPVEIDVYLTEAQDGGAEKCYFAINERVLGTTTIESKFPNVEKVLSRCANHVDVVANADALKASAYRLGLTGENVVQIDALDNKLVLLAESSLRGRVEEVLTVEYNQPGRTVQLNLTYLRQFLETCEAESLVLSLADGDGREPVLIRPATETDVTHVYCVAPCRK